MLGESWAEAHRPQLPLRCRLYGISGILVVVAVVVMVLPLCSCWSLLAILWEDFVSIEVVVD